MSFIIGTSSIHSEHGSGAFTCPECGAPGAFAGRRVRRWLTFFGLPVLPMGRSGSYVECKTCRATFEADVIGDAGVEGEDLEAGFKVAARRIMIHMMIADGRIGADEEAVIAEHYERLTGVHMEPGQIVEDVKAVGRAQGTAADYAQSVTPMLNDYGKELVLRAAFAVACVDGHVHEREARMLEEIGGALEMTPAHVRGVLAEMDGMT